ncbi:cvnh domain-containing protein [Colletotrichum plurivorum]|uniref:Cvnh domain-containing protein n=1 Tax=Colletotrichum plurivorum TaxID=2175906 RepID=A0A8H6K180_9PEZI|nr:cvnh domain-containing protein [Colletotrichum plurivorum]
MKVSTLALPILASLSQARDCPFESDCMQSSCTDFAISNQVQLPGGWEENSNTKAVLEAVCEDRHGAKVFTWLDLKQCLGNFDGNLGWAYQGGARCQNCKIKERGGGPDPVVMTCVCHGRGKKINKNAEINLSEGIWNYDGVIGCYKADGHKVPI